MKLADMKEEKIALIICHELAHYLLDHQVLRLTKAIGQHYFSGKKFFKHATSIEVYDPILEEFMKKTVKQKYSCFYPQQRIITKFYEKNCDIMAISLWKKAYPDIDHEQIVD